jgi:hypothetical protein
MIDSTLPVLKNLDGRTFLCLVSARLEECLQALRNGDYYGVGISRYHGYQEDDLRILNEIPPIRGVHIQDRINDVSALSRFKDNLEYMLIADIGMDLDLAQFRRLADLRLVDWSPRHKNIGKCASLKHLRFQSYSPASNDLSELVELRDLETLSLTKGKLKRLNGVKSLKTLQKIHLRYLTALEDLAPLCECKHLEEIIIGHCKKVRDFNVLKCLDKLSILCIESAADLPSVAFLQAFKSLRRMSLVGTNIIDGDLHPLLKLPHLEYVGFLKKRHFTHTPEALNAILSSRKSA